MDRREKKGARKKGSATSATNGTDPFFRTKLKENVGYWVSSHTHPYSIWVYEQKDLSDGRFDGTNTHEWIESLLGHELDLHSADKKGRNRIFLDGLPDYGDYLVTGTVDGIDNVKKLSDQGIIEIDLTKKFTSVRLRGKGAFSFDQILGDGELEQRYHIAGYALSCLFWIELCEKHGDDLPRRFCSTLKEQRKRDFPSCIKILEKLTGESDLRERLELDY